MKKKKQQQMIRNDEDYAEHNNTRLKTMLNKINLALSESR
jgi:hypothetical protein